MSGESLVKWREWSDEAFREAREQEKPILLDIGAVWCHWCHVMDGGIPGDAVHTGTYSNPQVAAVINERFIPIKVDNDRRPDVNARYNMGGWPTTAFLTPEGDTLYGETYVTPDRMLGLLNHIAAYYRDNKGEIAARLREHEAEEEGQGEGPKSPGPLTTEIADFITGQIKASFDFHFGGFGTQPKFPHPEALEFAVRQYQATGDEELRLIVEKTLAAMAGGGMYDRYAGGFFRYSTTRDWSIPHYEKMLEDNALLSRVCLLAAKIFDEPKFAEIARDVHGWLMEVMYDPWTQTFAGSQDADKEDAYYGLPLDERAKLATPYIDRTVYLDWNALTVSSLIERYRQFQEEAVLSTAAMTYRFLREKLWPRHFHADGIAQGEEYLLDDVTAMLDAALDLTEVTGEAAYLDDARGYADVLLSRLQDHEHGGFYDLLPAPGALGALAQPKKELGSTSAAASALLRLYAYTGDPRIVSAAEMALRAYAGEGQEYRKYGLFAAPYGLAVQRALTLPAHIVIVGDPASGAVAGLRQAAWSALRVPAAIETRSPDRAGEYPADPAGVALAYVCIGTNCTIAATDEELVAILRRSVGATAEQSV